MAAKQKARRRWIAEQLTFVGHPFAAIGMGDQMRSHFSALQTVGADARVYDVYRYAPRTDPSHLSLVGHAETAKLGDGFRIFHINGDEIDAVLEAIRVKGDDFQGGYNIIIPAWELPVYPDVWAEKLKLFDEVWAISYFVQQAFSAAGVASYYVGQSIELPIDAYLPRKYFGITETAFVVLNFFDLSSYPARKNPAAVIELATRINANETFRNEYRDIQFVLKVKRGNEGADEWANELRKQLPNMIVLSRPMSAFETHSLINCCDCFVSLHRSEGFGRGAAEAMFLGKLALATGWSGNVDYMSTDNSVVVSNTLVPVAYGAYPHADGQQWAEPNVDHATTELIDIFGNWDRRRLLSRAGARTIRTHFSHRAIGVRSLNLLLANTE